MYWLDHIVDDVVKSLKAMAGTGMETVSTRGQEENLGAGMLLLPMSDKVKIVLKVAGDGMSLTGDNRWIRRISTRTAMIIKQRRQDLALALGHINLEYVEQFSILHEHGQPANTIMSPTMTTSIIRQQQTGGLSEMRQIVETYMRAV